MWGQHWVQVLQLKEINAWHKHFSFQALEMLFIFLCCTVVRLNYTGAGKKNKID